MIIDKMDKTQLILTLTKLDGVGNITIKRIIDSIKLEEINLVNLFKILKKIPRLKSLSIEQFNKALKEAKELLFRLKQSDVSIITFLDPDYPKSFLELKNLPVVLFYSGDISLLSEKCSTIVGTRKPSVLSKQVAYKLSSKLCKDEVIVSGLAEGIDTQAHLGAIENNGKTIAILGHGLDIVFPPENKSLAKKIVETGGLLISEYPLGKTYSKYTFIARDRLQSAISDNIYVIETSKTGGTMHTARKAIQYNKQLFVFKSKNESNKINSGNIVLLELGANSFNEDFFN